MSAHSKDGLFKNIQSIVRLTKRKCPCCKRKVINPLNFKKRLQYQCSFCRGYIESSTLWSSIISIVLVVLQTIFYKKNLYVLGHAVFFVVVFRWIFIEIIDALTLPLKEYEP